MTQTLPLELVTRRQLADALGCHMQTVTKYEREGMPIAARGDRGKPSRYQLEDVKAWLAQRTAGAQAPVAAIALADVREAWADEIAAVRALLLSSAASRASRVHRAAALGVAGVARELQAMTSEVLRTLALADRPGEVGAFASRGAAPTSPVADTLRQARALYAPPAHLVVAPAPKAERVAAPAVTTVGRRVVARSNYLGR